MAGTGPCSARVVVGPFGAVHAPDDQHSDAESCPAQCDRRLARSISGYRADWLLGAFADSASAQDIECAADRLGSLDAIARAFPRDGWCGSRLRTHAT